MNKMCGKNVKNETYLNHNRGIYKIFIIILSIGEILSWAAVFNYPGKLLSGIIGNTLNSIWLAGALYLIITGLFIGFSVIDFLYFFNNRSKTRTSKKQSSLGERLKKTYREKGKEWR